MFYTCIIESTEGAGHYYVGSTEDLAARMADHNGGRSAPMAKYRPWRLIWSCAFTTRTKADVSEEYLKSASGRAFQQKHLQIPL